MQAPVAGVTGVQGYIPVQSHSRVIFKMTGIAVKEAGGTYISYERYIVAQMDNSNYASYCIGTTSLICDTITPEEWSYPIFVQDGDAEAGWGALKLIVYGLPEVDLMHNIKLELLETRNLTDY